MYLSKLSKYIRQGLGFLDGLRSDLIHEIFSGVYLAVFASTPVKKTFLFGVKPSFCLRFGIPKCMNESRKRVNGTEGR